MILCRINKEVSLCLFEHANTRKHIQEQSCSSVRVFTLTQLAHLAQSFFSDSRWDKCFDTCLSMSIKEGMLVSIAAHL